MLDMKLNIGVKAKLYLRFPKFDSIGLAGDADTVRGEALELFLDDVPPRLRSTDPKGVLLGGRTKAGSKGFMSSGWGL